MRKRGISPLIATVLLIGFTIALAVIIFFWINSFTEERIGKTKEIVEAELSCVTGIDIGIYEACVDSSGVHLTLENRKNNDIDGFIVRFESDQSTEAEVLEVDKKLGGLELAIMTLEPERIIIPDTVFIVPKLSLGGKVALCQEKAIEAYVTPGC